MKSSDVLFVIIAAALSVFCPAAGAQQTSELTLEECLQMSEAGDPYVRGARLDALAARSQKAEALWSYFPSVSINAMGYRSANPLVTITLTDILGRSDAARDLTNSLETYAQENGLNSSYTALRSGYGASVMALQPLYAGGRIVSGNRLAALGVQAADVQLRLRLRQTRQEVEKKYWTVVSLQEKETTLQRADELLSSLERDVRSAVAAGLAGENDLLQVLLKRKELSSGRVKLRSGLKLAKMDLFNAIGYQYRFFALDSVALSGGCDSLLAPRTYVVPEENVPVFDESSLLGMQVESKKLEKNMQVGEFLPQVAVGAAYGYGNYLHSAASFNGIAFATVQVPITDIGKAVNRSRRYNYQIQKAGIEKEYLDAQLLLQLRQLQVEMESAWDQLEVAREAAEVAADSQRRLRADYDAGLATLSDLLQAELALRNCEQESIERRIDYRLAVSAYLSRVQ